MYWIHQTERNPVGCEGAIGVRKLKKRFAELINLTSCDTLLSQLDKYG